jgi:Kef-type K+ transport system membrane component KefB
MLTLAWILAIGMGGPLLALPKHFRVPVAVGEIIVGVIFGASGLRKVPLHNSTFSLIASFGFALVMMVAGSSIDVQGIVKHPVLKTALLRQFLVVITSLPLAIIVARLSHVHQVPLFVVLLCSSSAALVVPIFSRIQGGNFNADIAKMMTQVGIADLIGVLAIPLVMNNHQVSRVVTGAIVVTVLATILSIFYGLANDRGLISKVRAISKERHFGIELRVSLILLLILAGIAQKFSLSVMVAGFVAGLALAVHGVPHRLARQLFALTEGLFAPFFFVWLGAQIDIRSAFTDGHLLVLAGLLALFTILSHVVTIFMGAPLSLSIVSSAQLGVPVAAVTIGQSSGILTAGQGGAIMLAALLSILATLVATTLWESKGRVPS